ncbi:MAG TPA: YbhB/YbcL family Raf kinase inhibitor-like protein [Candidatus Cybelea sp.]|jgi:hypothetical protein|nr:YbhB/YbcL family Raf kinase inhibitor-like protein [Candidatus Cybelea sp.]
MVRVLAAAFVVASVASPAALRVSSSNINGGLLNEAFMARDCYGENRSPSLAWSGAPQGTRSFAIVMHDADAPIPGGFYHWVVYNVAPSTHSFPTEAVLRPEQLGETSARTTAYYGPCPPAGSIHNYTITVYALDVARVAAPEPLSAVRLQSEIAGHVLARGVLKTTAGFKLGSENGTP